MRLMAVPNFDLMTDCLLRIFTELTRVGSYYPFLTSEIIAMLLNGFQHDMKAILHYSYICWLPVSCMVVVCVCGWDLHVAS